MKDFNELLSCFDGVKQTSKTQYIATCPCCGKPEHLYITAPEAMTKGGTASKLYCQKCGAKATDITAAIGKSINFLYLDEERSAPHQKQKATKYTAEKSREHIYFNADGSIFGKKIIYIQPNGDKTPIEWYRYEGNKYISKLNGAVAPLYNLNIINTTKSTLFFAEGEKDVETLTRMGLYATTTPNGGNQKNWPQQFDSPCENRDIVILTDNDKTGNDYGEFIASHTIDIATSVRIITATAIYPEAGHKWDISNIAEKFGDDKASEMLFEALEVAEYYKKPAKTLRHMAKAADNFGDAKFSFVWEPYIPRGDYTVMMADGGTGKTILCCGIAAEISKGGHGLPGEPLAGIEREPQNVLIVSAEDPGEILKDRLKACGADLSRVFILDCIDSVDMNFTTDIADFEETIKACSPALVILDPWHAFAGENIDVNRVNVMRPVLQRLSILAKNCNCGLMLISHINKKAQGENINHAAIGSTDFINAARSALRVIFSDSPEEPHTRIAVHTKSNYAAHGQSIKFKITPNSGMKWDGFSAITRQTLEEAARQRKKPYELIEQRDYQAEIDAALIEAIKQHAKEGETVNISYDQMKAEHGVHIFGGRQAKRAIDAIAPQLESFGITLATGKRVKYNGNPVNGFGITSNSNINGFQLSVDSF